MSLVAPLQADVTAVINADARVSAAPAQHPDLLRFITCGSVDDGKSTLIGRLLYDSKSIFEDQMEALDKDSRKFGTQGAELDLALLVDGLAAEREQGITIDVAYRYFATPRRAFIVADTPGHEQYTRNMATGASSAELAIILIDARKGILPQTRRHSFIVSMLGVRHIAVAINKMDLVGFDKAVFDQISDDYRALAENLGFESIKFFPLSARDGDNVAAPSAQTPWFQGPPLLTYLETVTVTSVSSVGGALLPVQWVSRPNLDFRGFAGTLVRGTLNVGDTITALPRGSKSKVTRIVTADGDLAEASEGQAITLTLADEIDVSRGDVLVSGSDVPVPARRLAAHLLWTGDRPLASGAAYILKLGTTLADARIVIENAVDIHSYAAQPATTLDMNGIATAQVILDRPLVAVPYRDNRDLGGFILIDRFTNETIAFGLVDSVLDDTEHSATAAAAIPSTRLVDRAGSFLLGRRGAQLEVPHQEWALLILTTLVSALVVWALTGSGLLAAVFGVADLILRPLVTSVWTRFARRQPPADTGPFHDDGADI